jgi:hypothetical protein
MIGLGSDKLQHLKAFKATSRSIHRSLKHLRCQARVLRSQVGHHFCNRIRVALQGSVRLIRRELHLEGMIDLSLDMIILVAKLLKRVHQLKYLVTHHKISYSENSTTKHKASKSNKETN